MTKTLADTAIEAGESSRLADEAQTAEYIGDLVTQLERLARSHGLVRLQYHLGLCREEAQNIATNGRAA